MNSASLTDTATAVDTAETMAKELQDYLAGRLGTRVDTGHDLFVSGLVSSIFAMELVVHLEQTYSVAIVGTDLKLDNFRSVDRMTELVGRLRETDPADRV